MRRRLLDGRQSLGDAAQRAAADAVIERIVGRVGADPTSGRVAAYLAYGGELDLRPSLRRLISLGFDVVVPVCGRAATITFHPWRPGDHMRSGRYGIDEPLTAPVELDSIATVLVPGVGFSIDGSRIGHGVGYYDRFFARCFAAGHDPRRLGIAHDLQVVELPEPESWDVAMHEIITPTKVIHVSQ